MIRPAAVSKSIRFQLEPIDLDGWFGKQKAIRPVLMHAAFGGQVTYTNPHSPKYAGDSPSPLTDGLRGVVDDFHHHWQGFEGTDLDAVIDLGKPQKLTKISLGCLHSTGSWIFLPKEVEFAVSQDGENWTVVGTESNRISPLFNQAIVKDFTTRFKPTGARYVRIRAKNVGTCPPWHAGAGGKAWLFVDEVKVK